MDDVLDGPVSLREMAALMTMMTIEIIGHATLTGGNADGVLTDMANDFLEKSRYAVDPRMRAVLSTYARSLIATEPGAGIE